MVALSGAGLDEDVAREPADRTPRPWRFVIGIDFGQARDFTAVVVAEVGRVPAYRKVGVRFGRTLWRQSFDVALSVRALVRPPLGTSYVAIAEMVGAIVRQLPLLPERPLLIADATGCGRPVLDLLTAEGLDPVIGVTITGGADTTWTDARNARVPKRALVSRLTVALQAERVKIAAELPLAEVLTAELGAFRAKISASGSESFEAWRERDHDDLVLALALAGWGAELQPSQPLVEVVRGLNHMRR